MGNAAARAGAILSTPAPRNFDAEETMVMTHESYKAWLDEMPIDDVRRRIERLERKLADLQVLERLYDERYGADGASKVPASDESEESAEAQALGEADSPGSGEEGHEEG